MAAGKYGYGWLLARSGTKDTGADTGQLESCIILTEAHSNRVTAEYLLRTMHLHHAPAPAWTVKAAPLSISKECQYLSSLVSCAVNLLETNLVNLVRTVASHGERTI
jgi:hypothetical protein